MGQRSPGEANGETGGGQIAVPRYIEGDSTGRYRTMDDALLMGIGEGASQLGQKTASLLEIEPTPGETLGQGAATKPHLTR